MSSPLPFDPGNTATNFVGFNLSVDVVGGDENLGANWLTLDMGSTSLQASDAPAGGYQLSRFQLLGELSYGDVTLSRPWTPNQSGWIPMWFALAEQYGGTTVGITINYLDASGILKHVTYNFKNAYPVSWNQPEFAAVPTGEAIPRIEESITFSHSGYFDTDGLAPGIDTAEAVQPCKLVILPGSGGNSSGIASALSALTSWTLPGSANGVSMSNQTSSDAASLLGPYPAVTFWVPPQTIQVSKSADWDVTQSPSASGSGPVSWNGTLPTTMDFDFILDGSSSDLNAAQASKTEGEGLSTSDSSKSVLPTAEQLLALCEVDETSEVLGFGSAPLVVLVWGQLVSPVSYVKSIDLKFTKFNSFGQPIRAEGSLSLSAYPVYDALQNPTSGGESPRQSAILHEADTLAHVAFRTYQSPARWRDLAEANGITDPMRLSPGTRLLVPSPDELPTRGESNRARSKIHGVLREPSSKTVSTNTLPGKA